MWMKLSLLLICVCTVSDSVQKRSSVLTDESKRILNIFDFSNFDKQEALSYIDRQGFENLIRGKTSKWNLSQNLLNSNLASEVKKNDKIQKEKYESTGAAVDKCSKDETISNNDRTNLKSIRHREVGFESFKQTPMKFRTGRSPESFEDNKDLERNDSDSHKNDNGKITKVTSSLEENDFGGDVTGETGKNEKGKRRKKKKKKRHHWSKWTEWSPCSVTCGKGRRIRSRKCIAKSCESGELEMGEKTCQLPACSFFDKFFSFLT